MTEKVIWEIFKVGKKGRITKLGAVLAKDNPHALIKAYTKFKIKINKDLCSIFARRKGIFRLTNIKSLSGTKKG